MKLTATSAPNAGNLVLFWPENMAEGAEARLADEPAEVAQELRDEGKLIWFDGCWLDQVRLALFVDEPLPTDLPTQCVEQEKYELTVRGRAYFGELERMARNVLGGIKAEPGVCEEVHVPAGRYTATVLRCDHGDEKWDRWIAEHTSKGDRLLWRLGRIVESTAVLGVLAVLGSFFFVSWTVWWCILGAAVGWFLLGVALLLSAGNARVQAAVDEYHKTFPEFVVQLE